MKINYDELIGNASIALKNSYSPYSKSKVGAAVLTKSGNVYLGCNVENSSFSVTSCAERNAISSAVLLEGPQMEISAIAISSVDRNNKKASITPCGSCRQAIIEFGKDAEVVFSDDEGKLIILPISELIPHAYTAKTFLGK